MKLLKSFIYYFLTSGLIISAVLVFLENIAHKYKIVNFFAFASGSFFLFNLAQFNVINNTNPLANRGFLIHTLLGITLWVILAILMYFLNEFKYNIIEINSIILSTFFFGFIIYFSAYYYGYLNF